MLLFLTSEQRSKARTYRIKDRTCRKHVVLENLGDISVVCSHCCLMVQYLVILDIDVSNYVTMFV
jgi:hypothetical protein